MMKGVLPRRTLVLFALAAGVFSAGSEVFRSRVASAASLAPGATLVNADVVLRRVPNGGIQPEAAIDSGGVLHLLYFSGEPAGGDLFYVRSTDLGATFSTPLRVNSQPGSAIATGTIRGGQLALGRNGRVHVAWNGSDRALPRGPVNPDMNKPGAPFLYARSNAAGTAFEPQRNINLHVYSLDGGGSIAADSAGHVYAAWHGNKEGGPRGEDKRQVWLVRSQDDGATFGEAKPAWDSPTGACGCCQTRLLATSATGLALLYRSAAGLTNRDVYVLISQDGGQSFAGSRAQAWSINACPMTSMSLASSGARLMAAWETAGQVYWGRVDPNGRAPEPAAAPGAGEGRKHPRLALSPTGESILVWTEKTGWARGGSLGWQVFDASGHPSGSIGSASGIPVWSFPASVARPGGGFVVFY
jgi:hypothetical protein